MKSISVGIVIGDNDAQAVIDAVRAVAQAFGSGVMLGAKVEDVTLDELVAAKRASPKFNIPEAAAVDALRRSYAEAVVIRENGHVATPGGLRHWSEVYPKHAALVDTWSTK